MAEEWREIPGTVYSVSSEGRVSSGKCGKMEILKPSVSSRGYHHVSIYFNGTKQTRPVHRLVAEAFLGPRPTPRHEVNHKDGDKTNNCVKNLEWVTPGQNIQHSYTILGDKAARGKDAGPSKLVEADVRVIRVRLSSGELQRIIAADYGVRQPSISDIALGKTWGWLP